MSTSIEALKQAALLEKSALDQYNIAMDNAVHQETKDALKGYIDDKKQKIDTLAWVIMAESGKLEKDAAGDGGAHHSGEAAPAEGGGKCPFTAQLKEMGVDLTKMGDAMKPHE